MYNSYIIPFEDVDNILKHMFVYDFYKTDTHVFIMRLEKENDLDAGIQTETFSIILDGRSSRFIQDGVTKLSGNFHSGSMFSQLHLKHKKIAIKDMCYEKNKALKFTFEEIKIFINLTDKDICSNFDLINNEKHVSIGIESEGYIILGPSNIPLNDYCNDGKLHTGLLSDWI